MKWMIAILCLLPVALCAQENKRKKYVDSLDRVLHIDKSSLLAGKDSVIVIHFYGSVYQVFQQKDRFKIIQTLILEKQTKSKSFETTLQTDTFFVYRNSADAVLNDKKFAALFDFFNATNGKLVLTMVFSTFYPPEPRDLYVESFGGGNYKYQEISSKDSEMLEYNNETYEKMMESILEKFDHWKRLELMVRKKGPGIYSFNKQFKVGYFEYKSNGKFKFLFDANEFSQVPRY